MASLSPVIPAGPRGWSAGVLNRARAVPAGVCPSEGWYLLAVATSVFWERRARASSVGSRGGTSV